MLAGETDTLPEVDPAVKPVPVQLVALVLLHVSVDDLPPGIDAGLAEREAVGMGVVLLSNPARSSRPRRCRS